MIYLAMFCFVSWLVIGWQSARITELSEELAYRAYGSSFASKVPVGLSKPFDWEDDPSTTYLISEA